MWVFGNAMHYFGIARAAPFVLISFQKAGHRKCSAHLPRSPPSVPQHTCAET